MPLTDKEIKAIKPLEKSKKYFDGGGLYLEVTPDGGKRWRLKYRFAGKEKRISLGVYPKVSLKQAREEAGKAKELLGEGKDPSVARRAQKISAEFTFKDLANLWLEKHKSEVRPKSFELTKDMFKKVKKSLFWHCPPQTIKPRDILLLCKELENDISSIYAQKTLAKLSAVFRFGVVSGFVDSDPCRDIKSAISTHKTRHHPAITDPVELGKFIYNLDIQHSSYIAKSSLMVQLLTLSRPSEIRLLTWEEVDFDSSIIRISSNRMKMGRDHLIPMSSQVISILKNIRKFNYNSSYIFCSRKLKEGGSPIVPSTLGKLLIKMGYRDIMVPHGFRSTASTILNEMGWPPDVIEAQLAHAIPGVRAVYNRAVYLDERRRMLQAWADYLDELKEKAAPA